VVYLYFSNRKVQIVYWLYIHSLLKTIMSNTILNKQKEHKNFLQ